MERLIIKSKRHGEHTVFYDTEDAELISRYKWHLNISPNGKIFYANAVVRDNKKQRSISMHRLLMGFPLSLVDHKDNNGLNNTRVNLRLCERSQNGANQINRKNNTLGFKGIVWEQRTKRYRTVIRYKGRNYRGGRFKNIIDAAKKYNELAVKYFGEFAKLNIIP